MTCRSSTERRATVVNRLPKVLEWANLKLTSVVSNVTGVSARAILAALLDGEQDSAVLADLAQGKLRRKRAALEQALVGRLREQHGFLIAHHLTPIDFLDEQIAEFNARITQAEPSASPPTEQSPSPRPATEPTSPASPVPCGNLIRRLEGATQPPVHSHG